MFLSVILEKGKKMTCGLISSRGRRSGFTLIELLVVIAIIALLLSILMPSLNKVKEMGRQLACANNLKQGMLAIRMYSNDYQGRLPGAYPHYWYKLINPYSGHNIQFSKGNTSGAVTTGDSEYELEAGFGVGWSRCPSAKKDAIRTYAANYPTVLRHEPGYYANINKSANLDKIPGKVFILGDHYGKDWGHGADYTAPAIIFHPQGWQFDEDWNGNGDDDTSTSTGYGPYNGWYPWHLKAGNMGHADNSVRPLKLTEWEDVWITAYPNLSSGRAKWDFWGRYGFDSYQ